MKNPVCSLYLLLSSFRKMSAAFDGVYDFHSWDISHEFMVAFMKHGKSTSNKNAQLLEREICETLWNIQNNFHSAVNAFIALERKHDEILGKINSGMDESKVNEHIVRIIVLFKRWLLQIEEGYCMGTKDKKNPRIIQFGNKALYLFGCMGNCLNHLQQFNKNSRKSCIAGVIYSLLV